MTLTDRPDAHVAVVKLVEGVNLWSFVSYYNIYFYVSDWSASVYNKSIIIIIVTC